MGDGAETGGGDGATTAARAGAPRRILVDTDMDTDDLLALLYILKHSRAEFDVKVGAMSPSLPSSWPPACGRATCHRRLAPPRGSEIRHLERVIE